MDNLIARLEAAAEGSRELDSDIAVAINWPEIDYPCPKNTPWKRNENLPPHFWNDANYRGVYAPHYTTSIDAALTLLPEGWGIGGIWEAIEPKDHPWWGCSLRRDKPYGTLKVMGVKTLPLALCIACLKARL